MPKTVVVVPTVREDCLRLFKARWQGHFLWHRATLVVVRDGDDPTIEVDGRHVGAVSEVLTEEEAALVPRFTDSCRSAGFLWAAANLDFDSVVTLDDDVAPLPDSDPVGDLLRPLRTRVPISFMNTLLGGFDFVRGIPYAVRAEAEVHLSHAGWVGSVDWDGVTQQYLTPQSIADPDRYSRPDFYRGPIPRGVRVATCGMAIAFTREAAPLIYYTPQGKSVDVHRYGDIWMGLVAKAEFDKRDWAFYYGNAIVDHTRASNVYKNMVAEAKGMELNERWWKEGDDIDPFFAKYREQRLAYQRRMEQLLGVAA